MELLIAYRGDINNPRCWSGTPYNLKKQFEAISDLSFDSINWQINRNILRIYHRLLQNSFFIHGTAKDPYISTLFEKKLSSIIKKIQTSPDFVLFISDYLLTDKISNFTNYACYIDAFMREQIKYSDDNRIGKNQFIKYYELRSRESMEQMSLIFTQNEWTRQCLLKEYAIAAERVHNVSFGINTAPYNGEKHYDDELLLIVLRKGTEKYKGLLLLLEAFKILKKKRAKAKLAVVGTQLEDKPDGVTYYFNQPRSVTVELFRKASLYVMPALNEPNGITYLEALANRAPIVGLNRFTLPEFSNNGEWGFMAQNEEPEELAMVIDQALEDKEQLRVMGERGQKFVVNRYRWDIVARKMVDTMQQHLHRNKR